MLSGSKDNSQASYFVLAGAVILYALIPAVIGYIDGKEIPFLFQSAWRAGVVVGILVVLVILYRTSKAKEEPNRICDPKYKSDGRPGSDNSDTTPSAGWKISSKAMFVIWVIAIIIGNCDYALFAFSLNYIGITFATTLFGLWPIFNIGFKVFRREELGTEGRPMISIAITLTLLASLCVIGFSFITLSNPGVLSDSKNYVMDMAIGVGLAFSTVILVNVKDVFGTDRGEEFTDWLSKHRIIPETNRTASMVPVLVLFLISSLGASIVCAVVGFARNEDFIGNMEIVGWASAGGFFISALAGTLWRKANNDTKDREGGIEKSRFGNVWGFAIPVSALSFLFLTPLMPFATSFRDEVFNVEHFEYFVLGATAILAANLIASYINQIRWSFEALILGLGGCGTLVYFREDLFDWLGSWIGTNIVWTWSEGAYFGSIAMSATVFALILAFRVARQVTRTSAEENHTFRILRTLDTLVKRGVIRGEARDKIKEIDKTNNQRELETSYKEARGYFDKATPVNDFDRGMLRDAEAELDMLVRSQQVSTALGELFAMLIFAGITVFQVLLTRPDLTGSGTGQNWIPLGVDLFAMLVSSVIIFLMIYSIDLDRDRDADKLEEKCQKYRLKFNDTGDNDLADQWLSGIAGGIIIVVYIGLLAHKWLWATQSAL